MSLAAVNYILCDSWDYERLQKSKDSLKACFENVNINLMLYLLNPKDSFKGHKTRRHFISFECQADEHNHETE